MIFALFVISVLISPYISVNMRYDIRDDLQTGRARPRGPNLIIIRRF
jgi:hypothetical protein